MSAPIDPRAVGPRIRMMLPDMSPLESRITDFLLRTDFDDTLPAEARGRRFRSVGGDGRQNRQESSASTVFASCAPPSSNISVCPRWTCTRR